MKIDNLQVPKAYSKKETSKFKEPKEDFSKVLSGTISTSSEKNLKEDTKVDKIVDLNMEDIDVEEDSNVSVNSLLMFINMPLFEEKVLDIAQLGEEQLVNINLDTSAISSQVELDTMQIVDTSPININPSESFVLEESLLDTPLLNGKTPSENKEIINIDDRSYEDKANLEINNGNRLINHISKQEPNNRDLSIDSEFTPVNEVKELNLEEISNVGDQDLTKRLDDKVLDIKKDETIGENKWLTHNIDTNQKINMANEIDGQSKVISNENMQNINDSIIQLIETTREGNTNIMKVQLYPEELGAVNITLKMEDGKLIAKIIVDDDYVKQLFTGKIELLNNNLVKQNVNMESIFVELNSNTNSNSNGDSGQNNNNFANQNKSLKFQSESIDEIIKEEIHLNSGELSILA